LVCLGKGYALNIIGFSTISELEEGERGAHREKTKGEGRDGEETRRPGDGRENIQPIVVEFHRKEKSL